MHNQSIYSKIDWLTVMFEDTTFNCILEFLKLDPAVYVSEFLKNQGERSQGMQDKKFFAFEGVNLEVNFSDIIGAADADDFEKVFSKIRLDIGGHGLDFLRSTGLPVDDYFRNLDSYPKPFHLTRCDFAYDLINYKSDFMDNLIKFCYENVTAAGNICLLHQKNGIKCSIHSGAEKTVYLGASGSRQFLRCYDKRLQYIDKTSGSYVKDNPYDNPDSWIRIELQTRRDYSMKLLFGEASSSQDYWFALFRHIYETYCFVDYVGTNKNNRRPADFWLNLYNWEEVHELIQNENCISFVPYHERVVSDFYSNILRMLRWFAVAGSKETVQGLINSALVDLFDYDNPRSERRRNAYLATLNMLLVDDHISIADSFDTCDFGFYRDLGRLFFKL